MRDDIAHVLAEGCGHVLTRTRKMGSGNGALLRCDAWARRQEICVLAFPVDMTWIYLVTARRAWKEHWFPNAPETAACRLPSLPAHVRRRYVFRPYGEDNFGVRTFRDPYVVSYLHARRRNWKAAFMQCRGDEFDSVFGEDGIEKYRLHIASFLLNSDMIYNITMSKEIASKLHLENRVMTVDEYGDPPLPELGDYEFPDLIPDTLGIRFLE